MRWVQADVSGSPPAARYGHSAVTLDARDDWGAELVVLYGGTSKSGPDERKIVYGDVAVYRVSEERWFTPDMKSSISPVARAFHSAVALGCRMYMFGGHITMLDQAGTHDKGVPMKLYFNDVWCLNMVRSREQQGGSMGVGWLMDLGDVLCPVCEDLVVGLDGVLGSRGGPACFVYLNHERAHEQALLFGVQ